MYNKFFYVKKKTTWKLDIARTGYENCTCEEEHFKNPLRGESANAQRL